MVLVPALLELAVLLLTLALATLATIIVVALFESLIRALSAVGLGGILTDWLRSIEQALTSALGTIEHGVDAAIGHSWHAFARFADGLWKEIRANADALLAFAGPLGLAVELGLWLKHEVHRLTRSHTTVSKQVKVLERELHGIDRELKKLERDVSRGIGADVLPRLKALEREVGKVEHKTIPAIERADAQAETAISNLWKWVHANVIPVGTTAFAGAVAVALTGLGLGGLRCPGFLRLLSKRGCGLGGLLDALLGLAISALALENVCTLLPILESAFGEVVGPVTRLLNEVPLGGCETPPKGWATLSVAAGPLPPRQTLGPLPV